MVEKNVTQILEYVFSCKLYTNLLLDASSNTKKMFVDDDSKIYMCVDIPELRKFIDNAKSVFAQNNMKLNITDIIPFFTYQKQLHVHSCENISDTNIKMTKDIFWYDDKIKNFKRINIDDLDDVSKEAFFGLAALKSLSLYKYDILSQEAEKKIMHLKK